VSYAIIKRKDPGAHILHAIFRTCLSTRKIPSAWKEANTTLIYKKGDKQDLANWRPIALSSCLYKVYTGVLADRLGRWAAATGAVSSVQKGFMPAEGCLEHNFLLQQCLDDARATGSPLTITWLDLRNAFGSVPHAVILSMLQHHGVPEHLVDVVRDAYQGCTTTFSTASGLSRAVPMASGVKQGDPLSPITFNLTLEAIIRSVLALAPQHGYLLLGHNITCLAYADDLVLTARSPADMQALLDVIGEVATWLGLHFNAAKCATLALEKKKALPHVATSVQGQPIPTLAEKDAYQHLGVPTGLYVDQTPENTINHMLQDLHHVEVSALTDWQKLDAIRTFIIPQAQFVLGTARVRKTAFQDLDKEIKRVAKKCLHLPSHVASKEIVFLPLRLGGADLLPLSELADVGAVTKAFKVLTCPDPLVRLVAEASLQRAVNPLVDTGAATKQDMAAYLSGVHLARPSHSFATVWSAARNASRRLNNSLQGFSWSWSEDLQRYSVSVSMPGREPNITIVDKQARGELHRSMRVGLQHRHHLNLLAKPHQGKVLDAAAMDPASNHFLAGGRYTRFCDWRFIHRARLGVLPLNNDVHVPGRSKACRVCKYDQETVAHVLCHCHHHSRAWNNRHRSVIANLVKAMPPAKKATLRVEKTVPGTNSRLMPDLVLLDERDKTATVIDIACPFDNRRQALSAKRAEKSEKYGDLCNILEGQGYKTILDAVVVGALGSWDPANDPVLGHLGIPKRFREAVKRRCVSDVIRWSRDIYVEHVSGHRQYQQDVTIPTR
jgi:hypothetical protein